MENILRCEATLEGISKYRAMNDAYLSYTLSYSSFPWTYTFQMYAISHQNEFIPGNKMKVSDLVNTCDDIEIWYTGNNIKWISFLQSSHSKLVYTKGIRVTSIPNT